MGDTWFQDAWAEREEQIYPELFGRALGGLVTLTAEHFRPFAVNDVDERWLQHGVLAFGPNRYRRTWLYVTSGLSNAWHANQPEPAGPSGLGCELVLETEQEGGWQVPLLQRLMAFQILLGWGHFPGKAPLGLGDRIPLRGPIDGGSSELTWGLFAPPFYYDRTFRLPTGSVELLHLTGITDDEAQYAREHSTEELIVALNERGYPVTEPQRRSVVAAG